jgi:hypothetical protein
MSIAAGGASTCILNGLGQRLCAGNGQFGQLATATPSTTNTSPAPTVIPSSLTPTSFSVPTPFVTVSDATNPGVCTLLLSVKVDATCKAAVFTPPLKDTTVNATSVAGAVVTYTTPTATVDGVNTPVTCAPASGSQFPIGTTTVTCTAGASSGTFKVLGRWGLYHPGIRSRVARMLKGQSPPPVSHLAPFSNPSSNRRRSSWIFLPSGEFEGDEVAQ